MKKLSLFAGSLSAALVCAAVPASITWSPGKMTLSLDTAEARIGRPLTATSVAGVSRRVYRRGYRRAAVGAAVGAAAGAYYGTYGYPGYAYPDYSYSSPGYAYPGYSYSYGYPDYYGRSWRGPVGYY